MIDERRSNIPRAGSHSSMSGFPSASNSPVQAVLDKYLAAALDGDRSEALRIIREEGISAGLSISQIYLGVIQAAQYRVGKMWEAGEVTVSQEHLATGISQLAIAQLYSMMPSSHTAGYRVLIACVPGETHDMGPRIVADFFEMAGFEVRYLGADVPVQAIVQEAKNSRPDIVALSATMTYNLPAFRDTVTRLRAELGDGVRIAAGGQAFLLTPELLEELEIPIRATDARELVEQSRRSLGMG